MCVRFLNIRHDDHITPRYEKLKWLNADDRGKCLQLTFIYSILATNTPSYH